LLPENNLTAMDFGCGLGAHGLFLESLGKFKEIIFLDQDPYALNKLRELPTQLGATPRRFISQLSDLSDQDKLDVVIDRASLQHNVPSEIAKILQILKHKLLSSGKMKQRKETRWHGILFTEWVLTGQRELLTKRFPNITFYSEAKVLLESQFRIIDKKVISTVYLDSSRSEVINLVLQPKLA
jgi:hypothetical protein